MIAYDRDESNVLVLIFIVLFAVFTVIAAITIDSIGKIVYWSYRKYKSIICYVKYQFLFWSM